MSELGLADNEIFLENAESARQETYVLGNPDLPIANHRQELEQSFVENTATVVEGTTGSGKSTNVPQIILEMRMSGRLDVGEIILTSPHIMTARTLSERIAAEISSKGIDAKVGYFTQPEGTKEPQYLQDIAVVTEAKVAMQIMHRHDDASDKLRYLIIDEVHDFGIFTELLLAIARKKTNPQSPDYDKNFRVVVMSATLDSQRMKQYFSHTSTGHIEVKVPTHPIEETATTESIAQASLRLATEKKGTVLAFHAGKGEIESTEQTIARLQANTDPQKRVGVVQLHAQQNAEQQKLAFESNPNGLIVLTTNVAETSVTVPDAVGVVCGGEVRVASMTTEYVASGSAVLDLGHISQSSFDQRKGRTGRTGPGVHIAVTQNGGKVPVPYAQRPKYATPPIKKESVDDLLLLVKAIGCEMSDFDFFHEVPAESIEAAKTKLFILGAIDETGNITKRGRRMDSLPLEPEYACMVAYAEERGFNDEVRQNILDIVAIMQRGGLFSRSPKKQKWRELLELDVNGDPQEKDSDFIAQLEAYVELIDNKKPEYWEHYDVNVHALELVAERREKLAWRIGISNLQKATVVDSKNRAAVLACIHAGQLSQLWQSNGDRYNLLLGPKIDFDKHPSSVVANVGKLATGTLFSLGFLGEFRHSVQDMNNITDPKTLVTIADHLIHKTIVAGTTVYSAEHQVIRAKVKHKLGSFVVMEGYENIEITEGSEDQDALKKLHADNEWAIWLGTNHDELTTYTAKTIDKAIANPESLQYGTSIDGKPLLAWVGANKNKPMRTKEDAIKSLIARQASFIKGPAKIERKITKEKLAAYRSKLIEISNGNGHAKEKVDTAKQLLRSIKNTPEDLGRVMKFLDIVEA